MPQRERRSSVLPLIVTTLLLGVAAASAAPARVTIEYIAHACFIVQSSGGTRVAIAPYNGRRWPGSAFPDHPQADAVLVSHPPHSADAEWNTDMGPNVRGPGPEIALRGGPDGLSMIRPLIDDAPHLLRAAGLLVIEIAAATADAVRAYAEQSPLLESVEVIPDLEGRARTLVASRNRADESSGTGIR